MHRGAADDGTGQPSGRTRLGLGPGRPPDPRSRSKRAVGPPERAGRTAPQALRPLSHRRSRLLASMTLDAWGPGSTTRRAKDSPVTTLQRRSTCPSREPSLSALDEPRSMRLWSTSLSPCPTLPSRPRYEIATDQHVVTALASLETAPMLQATAGRACSGRSPTRALGLDPHAVRDRPPVAVAVRSRLRAASPQGRMRSDISSGAYQCYDEQDTMCYDDSGPYFANGGTLQQACSTSEPTEVWDCGLNDYFAVSRSGRTIPAGTGTPATAAGRLRPMTSDRPIRAMTSSSLL